MVKLFKYKSNIVTQTDIIILCKLKCKNLFSFANGSYFSLLWFHFFLLFCKKLVHFKYDIIAFYLNVFRCNFQTFFLLNYKKDIKLYSLSSDLIFTSSKVVLIWKINKKKYVSLIDNSRLKLIHLIYA